MTKVHNVWAKNVERSYLSWHWRVIQNLKKTWLVVWKMTWGIWEIFTRALSSGLSRDQCISLKFTGELCIMTMKRDAKFEKELTCKFKVGMRNLLKIGMRNLLNFHQSTQKISKIYTLMGCFWPKYIMFELKKYKRVMFDGTED